jgi:hypothetical protein
MTERDWTTRTPDPGETVEAEGIVLRVEEPAGATLISGDLEAAVAALAPGAPMLGLLDDLPDGPFALRIARDRALLCTRAPLGVEGWHGSHAASAADDLFLIISVTGPRAPELRAACMSAEAGSPSAATLFAGQGALVSRAGDGIVVRVQRPEAAAVWATLTALVRTV